MNTRLEILVAQALQLSLADKSHLLERLIASLDADEEYAKAWEAVADQREADIASGRAHWVDGDEALLRLRASLVR
jgi:Putative addiction module component